MIKKLILGTALYFAAAASAFANGYYEKNVSSCDMESMRAALDNAAAQSGAVITVVKCEDTPVAAPVQQEFITMDYSEFCCDCCDDAVFISECVKNNGCK